MLRSNLGTLSASLDVDRQGRCAKLLAAVRARLPARRRHAFSAVSAELGRRRGAVLFRREGFMAKCARRRRRHHELKEQLLKRVPRRGKAGGAPRVLGGCHINTSEPSEPNPISVVTSSSLYQAESLTNRKAPPKHGRGLQRSQNCADETDTRAPHRGVSTTTQAEVITPPELDGLLVHDAHAAARAADTVHRAGGHHGDNAARRQARWNADGMHDASLPANISAVDEHPRFLRHWLLSSTDPQHRSCTQLCIHLWHDRHRTLRHGFRHALHAPDSACWQVFEPSDVFECANCTAAASAIWQLYSIRGHHGHQHDCPPGVVKFWQAEGCIR